MSEVLQQRKWRRSFFSTLLGREYGFLRVLGFAGSHNGNRLWRCVCRRIRNGQLCGNEHLVITSHLTRGQVLYCEPCTAEMKSGNLKLSCRVRKENGRTKS